MRNRRTRTLAAIDIGTNSFHLIVVSVDPRTGRFKILDREKEIVRLGAGGDDMRHLSPAAMNRGIAVLRRFHRIVQSRHADIRAVGTSAVREAENREEFIRRAKEETGIHIEVASGIEEARLIYMGALQALPVYDDLIFLLDIGGGSTEFVIGNEANVLASHSLKVGAVRLTDRFFPKGKTSKKAIRRCREFLAGFMDPVFRQLRQFPIRTAVGTSGTITNLANLIRSDRGGDQTATLNNFSFTGDDLKRVVKRLLDTRTPEERRGIKGLDEARADIIVAGAIILQQVFEALKLRSLTVSEYALREGIIFDTIAKRYLRGDRTSLGDIRYESVMHLADQFQYEREHAHHVALLAVRLFDQLKTLHKLGDGEREYLEAASILHEIGLFLSHTQHHQHSYYLIRNAELMGFNEDEKEIIANIARYHRKSLPKAKHQGYRTLGPEEQAVVQKLAAILRIADGLDRTHSASVGDVHCSVSAKTVTVRLKAAGSHSVDLERWGAERKSDLFEETFGRKVRIVAASR